MFPGILKYGTLAFGITAIYILVLPWLTDLTGIDRISYLMALITPVVIYFALREAAVKFWQYRVPLFKAVLVGCSIGLISVVFIALGHILLYALGWTEASFDFSFYLFFAVWRIAVALVSSILISYILRLKIRKSL